MSTTTELTKEEAERIIEFFNLSAAEQNEIEKRIKKFITSDWY